MTSEVIRVFPKVSELNKILNRIECPEEDCNEVFQNTPNLTLHLLKTHRKERSLKSSSYGNKVAEYYCPEPGCKYCFNPDFTNITDSKFTSRHFTQFKYLKQHYIKVHLDKSYKCEKCNKGFPTELHRSRHVTTCGSKYNCSCGAVYLSLESLQTHARRERHQYIKDHRGQNARTRKAAVTEPISSTINYRNALNILKSGNGNLPADLNIVVLQGVNLNEGLGKCENTGGNVSIGTQTDLSSKRRRTLSPMKGVERHGSVKKRTSKETQTGEKKPKTTTETQTVHQCLAAGEKKRSCCKAGGRRRKTSMATQTSAAKGPSTVEFNHVYPDSNPDMLSDTSMVPNKDCYDSKMAVVNDIYFPQLWLNDESNRRNFKESLDETNVPTLIDNVTLNNNNNDENLPVSFLGKIDGTADLANNNLSLYSCETITKDLMKESSALCHIETQTDYGENIDAFLDDYLTKLDNGSGHEVDDILDQYTQTCDDFLLPDDIDLCLTNNETQTAWPLCDDTFSMSDLVNSETQTIGTLSLDEYT